MPREGSVSVDLLSIPAQAPHRDLAEKFINYILDTKVGAKLPDSLDAATANQVAQVHQPDRSQESYDLSAARGHAPP